MTRVADTSFLITLFDHGDPRRRQALAWVEDPEPIEVPAEVVAETLGVIHKRRGYAASQEIWKGLIGLPQVTLTETGDAERAAEAFGKAKGKLSWVDAVVVAACRAEGHRPLCFDDAIVRAVRA